jgi:hypothetical protein
MLTAAEQEAVLAKAAAEAAAEGAGGNSEYCALPRSQPPLSTFFFWKRSKPSNQTEYFDF